VKDFEFEQVCRKIAIMQNRDPRPKSKNGDFKIEFNKRLIRFSLEIIKFCGLIRRDLNLKPLTDQLIRSGTSIGVNIVEAKGCGSKKEYIRFFEIALRSTNETKYWLILIRESDTKNRERAEDLLDEATQIGKIISSGILTMKGKNY